MPPNTSQPRVPELVIKRSGFGLRALGLVSPGVRKITAQIKPYTRWWSDQNQVAAEAQGPLWVVVGDSTSIGIGASAPDRGYVGLVLQSLRSIDPSWRVINLAMSGARVDDGLERQIPILAGLPNPDLVSMNLGSNDVFWERSADLRQRLQSLVEQLPTGSYVSAVAGSSERAKLANRTLRSAALAGGHTSIQPWREDGPGERLAQDRFHPNDLGYAYISQAFARSFGVPGPDITHH